MSAGFWGGNLKESNSLGELSNDGIILIFILKEIIEGHGLDLSGSS
jgi:hypothetical protein